MNVFLLKSITFQKISNNKHKVRFHFLDLSNVGVTLIFSELLNLFKFYNLNQIVLRLDYIIQIISIFFLTILWIFVNCMFQIWIVETALETRELPRLLLIGDDGFLLIVYVILHVSYMDRRDRARNEKTTMTTFDRR